MTMMTKKLRIDSVNSNSAAVRVTAAGTPFMIDDQFKTLCSIYSQNYSFDSSSSADNLYRGCTR